MKKIWIVVIVESGIATAVSIFDSIKEAESYKSTEEKKMNPEDDSISIFTEQVS